MMNDAFFCGDCGTRLDAPRVHGLCPGCLLRAGAAVEPAADDLAATVAFAEPTLADLGRLFPDLEVLELIDSGGMGSVYRVRQTGLDRIVALKLVRPANAGRASFTSRFEREARALAALNHPHIVTVHEFGHRGDIGYLLMEFVDGPNLRQVLDAGTMTPKEAMAIVREICDALQYAHEEGVVHRDIKPENILLDRRGRVKIADFGLAKLAARNDPTLTQSNQAMGTPRYMAPEQMEDSRGVDHRADIYSLGIVLYEMLTGELPIGRFDPPSKHAKVDVRVDEVVLRTLETTPERRYQSAAEVKTAIEHCSTAKSDLESDSAAEVGISIAFLVGLPLLLTAAVWWSESGWPLIALFLPGFGAGLMAFEEPKTGNVVATVSLMLMSLWLICFAMWRAESAAPLWSLFALVSGIGTGWSAAEDEKKKQRKREKKRLRKERKRQSKQTNHDS